MKYLMKRLDVIIVLILASSLALNGYLLMHVPEPVIQTITKIEQVDRPVMITKIVTKYETKIVTASIIISSSATIKEKADGYDVLVKSDLDIFTNPLTVVEDKAGKIFIPSVLTGNAKLAFLKWDINVNLNPKMEWKRRQLPIDVGFGLVGLAPEIGVCIDMPLLTNRNDIMIGFKGFNVGHVIPITKRTKFRIGIGLDYKKNICTFIGLKTNVF